MVAYQKNELVSATELAKKFGQIMNQIKEKSVDKIGVLKNNKLEAVVISTEEYEHLKMIEDMHRVNENIPRDMSRYSRKIQKALASGISEKSHEEIFEDLKKRYGS
jgi:PHD/YefM family antitoxin component YafN of YafNO toxin-antitoxin module